MSKIFKKFKPTTPSLRNYVKLKKKNLNIKPLLKQHIKGKVKSLGKNNTGKITMYHKGGGHKNRYRLIDFFRNKDSIEVVTSLEYDPNRTAFIASTYSKSKNCYSYIIAPRNLKIGDIVKSGSISNYKSGHSLLLSSIPVGTHIHNISLSKEGKGIVARAAGQFALLIEKNNIYCKLLLSNNKYIYASPDCRASIGIVSNGHHNLTTLGKAGRSRWLNKRPTVRGVAMNPIDHPHGGGEGKTSGGRTSVTPWGKSCKGGKTSNYKPFKYEKIYS